MKQGGRAAKFAFDPAVVVAYLDAHTTVATGGNPHRTRRSINGREVNRDTDARVIRRWRSVAEGLTLQGVARVLRKFDLTLDHLVTWAATQDLKPVLRGQLTLPTR